MTLTKIKAGQMADSVLPVVIKKDVSKTSTFTMVAADMDGCGHLVISNDTTTAAYTVTLPPPADWTGKFVTCLHQAGGTNILSFYKYGSGGFMDSNSSAATTYCTVFSNGIDAISIGKVASEGGGL